MKVVYAATNEQEEKIKELVEYIYYHVFPYYFSDEKILQFQNEKVLHISEMNINFVDTLKDGYQVIASLQTIISILESLQFKKLPSKYTVLFEINAQTINEYGLIFPFSFYQFIEGKDRKNVFSMYMTAENEYLI